jgi:hypothetical protein
METTFTEPENHHHQPQGQKPGGVVEHLREVITAYLKKRPQLSVNGISKKCNVSEPTLRRIMSLKIKTIPQVTTLLDILTFVTGTDSIQEIVKKYPGPIADYLKEGLPHIEEVDREYSNAVNEMLQDPIKYLIYKLSLNHSGVTQEKILELFGRHGEQLAEEMIAGGFIAKDGSGRLRSKVKSFHGSFNNFVRHFKAVADYIKPHKHHNRRPLNPFFVNCSDSVNAEAYEKIARLQRQTQKKISRILADPAGKGNIPVFYLCALDTLDYKSAYEIDEEELKDPHHDCHN